MSEFYGPHYQQTTEQLDALSDLLDHYGEEEIRGFLRIFGWSENEVQHAMSDVREYIFK